MKHSLKDKTAIGQKPAVMHNFSLQEQQLFRKGQNMLRAIYYVTRFMDTSVSLQTELREESHQLLRLLRSYIQKKKSQRKEAYEAIQRTFENIHFFLQLAEENGFLLPEQKDIFVRESIQILHSLKDISEQQTIQKERDREGIIFHIEELLKDTREESFSLPPQEKKEKVLKKKKARGKEKKLIHTSERKEERKSHTLRTQSVLKKRKEERKKEILQYLAQHPMVALPELCSLFEDCNSKTIQRDVQELVKKGLVEKKGERRWAKYTLV